MKIALCLYGQPRFINKGYDSLKSTIIDHYDCDVFIHTWNSKLIENKPFHYGVGWADKRIGVDDTKKYLELYNPTSYIVESPKDYSHKSESIDRQNTIKSGFAGGYDSDVAWKSHINASYCMWHSIHKVLKFITYPSQYSKIVLTRSDIGLNSFATNPDVAFEYESLNNPKLCNNWFNVLSPEIVSAFGSTFFNLETFYKENENVWCNELFVKHFLNKNEIPHLNRSYGLSLPSFIM